MLRHRIILNNLIFLNLIILNNLLSASMQFKILKKERENMFEGFLREDNGVTRNRMKIQHNYIKNCPSIYLLRSERDRSTNCTLFPLWFVCIAALA